MPALGKLFCHDSSVRGVVVATYELASGTYFNTSTFSGATGLLSSSTVMPCCISFSNSSLVKMYTLWTKKSSLNSAPRVLCGLDKAKMGIFFAKDFSLDKKQKIIDDHPIEPHVYTTLNK